jgi:3',5'-cyclic AMP phosphodiesterase CpdA
VRIVYTSDLHADLGERNAALLPLLAQRAVDSRPDVFIVAGDLAETAEVVTRSLRAFEAVPGLKLYLAGNHDLFVEGAAASACGATSLEKHERILPSAAAAAGFGYLGQEPVRFGGLGIVGICGWYDFGLRDPRLEGSVSLDHYRAGQWRDVRAFDRGQVLWPRSSLAAHAGSSPAVTSPPGSQPSSFEGDWASDEEICDWMLSRLEVQLAGVQDAPALLAVVHVLPFAELVQRGAFAPVAFHDAWLGSPRLGALLLQQINLRAVVCGHLHLSADLTLSGIRISARPVGNAAHSPLPLPELAHRCLGVLDLDC